MLFKRLLDLIASFVALTVLSPFLVLTFILIFVKLGKPVFFTQKRPGLNGIPFRLIKFRTLTNDTDAKGNLLPDEARLTRFGSFLRSTSIDEIPALFNVLKGEMSLVGPRPLRIYYLPLYNEFQLRRHEMRPGITGWAQVNGRNALGWEKKFELDVWYVNNHSFWLDIKILWMTIVKVINRENTTASDGGFTKPFCGTGDKMVSLEEVQLLKRKLG